MENDYLWDQKGEDKEIEKLENALRAFRYQPTPPPILSRTIMQNEEKSGFKPFPNFLRFAFAGMACLLIGLFTLAIWFQGSKNQIVMIEGYSAPLVTPIKVDFNETFIDESSNPPVVTKKSTLSRTEQVAKPIKIVYRQKTRRIRIDKPIHLTEEEKYAYNQLMLALSITGSKLKEVKDKANGIEEQTASIQDIK